eukprot:TRINITY_DN6541_c0_g1_i1.p1 TRINITY_DN6541_c0_g1~~TRINITY_DN6541_c0_g1_i1.p1  ORF type:complete len:325 (+),score=55.75 TRINITY_DN6541_c0_g1_i1:32-976(+)
MSDGSPLATNLDQHFIRSFVAAPPTPFTKDGAVSYESVAKQIENLKSTGIRVAFINGTTGESMSLTYQERIKLAEVWNEQRLKIPDFKLIVHVGTNSLEEAKQLSLHAKELKADAIAAMPPIFFKPDNVQVLVQCMSFIASAVPSMPFYYYHIPSMTGSRFRMIDFLTVAAPVIPNLIGIKYSDSNLMDFGECIDFRYQGRQYNMLFGSDEMLLGALALGAHGAVGSTYNIPFMMPYYHRLWEAYFKGDLKTARKQQKKSRAVVDLYIKYGGGTLKSLMLLCGVDLGQPRLPIKPLSQEQYENLKKNCQQLKFI